MPTDSPVRIGIIGAGRFAETHLDQFARVDGAEVVAVCRRNEDALRELQRRYDIPSGYTDYRDMLNAGGIDAVSIVTPTVSHHRIAMDAISAKLHVLCDKPLALNATNAKEMLDAAEKAGVVHSTNFNQRGNTSLGRIKRYVDSGYVGELIHIHIRWGQSMFDDVKPELLSWRGLANMGGGTVYELIHVFDAVRFLGGEVSRICALLRTSIPHRKFADAPEGMNVDAPDSSAFLLELHGGAYAVVHTSWVSRGTGPDGRTIVEFEVTGREGRIMSNGRYGIIGADMEIGQFSELDPGDPYPQPYELFINAIRSGEPVETSFVDGLKAAEIADAAIMSAREDRWIDL